MQDNVSYARYDYPTNDMVYNSSRLNNRANTDISHLPLSTTAQVVDTLQSSDFVNKYLTALQGHTTFGQRPDISQFAESRAYTHLFDEPVGNVTNSGNLRNSGNSANSQPYYELANAQEMDNPVKEVLFSAKNIHFLQQRCIETIYNRTNYLIEPQDESQLLQIITSVYDNIPLSSYDTDVRKGVSYLNSFILNTFIDYVYRGLMEYVSYSTFVSDGVQPIARPVNMSIKGSKTLLYDNTL